MNLKVEEITKVKLSIDYPRLWYYLYYTSVSTVLRDTVTSMQYYTPQNKGSKFVFCSDAKEKTFLVPQRTLQRTVA